MPQKEPKLIPSRSVPPTGPREGVGSTLVVVSPVQLTKRANAVSTAVTRRFDIPESYAGIGSDGQVVISSLHAGYGPPAKENLIRQRCQPDGWLGPR